MRAMCPKPQNTMNLISNYTRKLTARMTSEWMPFADVATAELPLPRLLRLSMFQLSIGLATALLVGTLNRVMIVELGVPAWWVALSVALPLLFAPLTSLSMINHHPRGTHARHRLVTPRPHRGL